MSKQKFLLHRWQRWLWQMLLAFFCVCGLGLFSAAQPAPNGSNLPALQPHPLPATLSHLQDPARSGDYFDQIKPVSVGYLVWSQFPVRVYVQPLQPEERNGSFSAQRSQLWIDAVLQAVQEWSQYLPLQLVEQPQGADITIVRSAPPLRLEPDSSSDPQRPRLTIGRARAAETRFDLYTKQQGSDTILSHRFTIYLRPDQAAQYTLATARHELGHAMGIWGHSPHETDALYFSQVRQPPQISPRDINTLKRIYEQPTRLGWKL